MTLRKITDIPEEEIITAYYDFVHTIFANYRDITDKDKLYKNLKRVLDDAYEGVLP